LLIPVSVWYPAILNRAISSLVRVADEPRIEAVAFANNASGFPAARTARTIADVTNKMFLEDAHGHRRFLHARRSTLASWYNFPTNQLEQPPLTEALKRAFAHSLFRRYHRPRVNVDLLPPPGLKPLGSRGEAPIAAACLGAGECGTDGKPAVYPAAVVASGRTLRDGLEMPGDHPIRGILTERNSLMVSMSKTTANCQNVP
jgi:hypothetical protein